MVSGMFFMGFDILKSVPKSFQQVKSWVWPTNRIFYCRFLRLAVRAESCSHSCSKYIALIGLALRLIFLKYNVLFMLPGFQGHLYIILRVVCHRRCENRRCENRGVKIGGVKIGV